MEALKPGTLCVIVGGCPENIGLVVEVLEHLGAEPPRADAYLICTASGRPFPELKIGPKEVLAPGTSNEAVTDRHKLRSLVDARGDESTCSSSNGWPEVRHARSSRKGVTPPEPVKIELNDQMSLPMALANGTSIETVGEPDQNKLPSSGRKQHDNR